MTNHLTYLYSEILKEHNIKILVFLILLLALMMTTSGFAHRTIWNHDPESEITADNNGVTIAPHWEYKDASRTQSLFIVLSSENVELDGTLVNLDLEFAVKGPDGASFWQKTPISADNLKVVNSRKRNKQLSWFLDNSSLPTGALEGRAVIQYHLPSGKSQIARVKLQRRITPF